MKKAMLLLLLSNTHSLFISFLHLFIVFFYQEVPADLCARVMKKAMARHASCGRCRFLIDGYPASNSDCR
jgi:hypothetical protein